MTSTLLKSNDIFSLNAGKTWVHCEAGQIWLSDDGQDIILERGQKWLTRGKTSVVIEALKESKVVVGNKEKVPDSTPHFLFNGSNSALAS